jgi:hypothetical protein
MDCWLLLARPPPGQQRAGCAAPPTPRGPRNGRAGAGVAAPARRQPRRPHRCLQHHPRRCYLRPGLVQQVRIRPAPPRPPPSPPMAPVRPGMVQQCRQVVQQCRQDRLYVRGYPVTTRSPALAGVGQCPLANGHGPSDGFSCEVSAASARVATGGPRDAQWGRAEPVLPLADRRQRRVLFGAEAQCTQPACAPSAGQAQ